MDKKMSQIIFAGTENFIDKKLHSLSYSIINNLLLVVFGSWAIGITSLLQFIVMPITYYIHRNDKRSVHNATRPYDSDKDDDDNKDK